MFTIPADGKIVYDAAALEGAKSIFITGDLIPRDKTEARLCNGETETVFGSVLPEILSCDLGITNLECTLTRGGEPIYKCGPNLKADPGVMPALMKAGFSVYALANNHSRDFGDEAFLETMKYITDAGGKYVGGGKDLAEASSTLFYDLKGLKLAIICASMRQACDCTKTTPGSNPLNPPAIAAQVAKARTRSDFVLVIIHDGKEQVPFPSERIRENYRAFVDAGAAAVIAHHPHTAQGFESYNGGFIAYSLGNFQFPPIHAEPPRSWCESFSLKLFVNDHKVAGIEVVPHHINEDQCLEVKQGADREEFLKRLGGLCTIAADDELCNKYYNAASMRYVHYENHIRKCLSLMDQGDLKDPEYLREMFYMNHYLITAEHFDLLAAQTFMKFHADIPEPPADLEYYFNLGKR